MNIDRNRAVEILRAAAAKAAQGLVDDAWLERMETFSKLCEDGTSKTHIAFLGTALIAKAVDPRADLYAIKPAHAGDNPNAFSARSLAHGVLVPLAAELGFSIGVTGREPLNNQPYFRMTRLDDGTPVHAGGRPAFDYMLNLIGMLQSVDEAEAATALAAFIAVRRRYIVRYGDAGDQGALTPAQLLGAIEALVGEDAEGGRRAQAVAAGLFDVVFGADRVESGRINDPSRKYPGDVCVRSAEDPDVWEKAVEVRDKPVSLSDIHVFGAKCLAMGVLDAAVLMASNRQTTLDKDAAEAWADERGLGLTLFCGWPVLVEQALYWSAAAKPEAALAAIGFIRDRLITVEASPNAVETWLRLTAGAA
ncbi:restriction endonuclease, SacI family [Brevundimonas sp. LF-1]|uniref:restriction endonuclease, SacI family n=1 Tax=Brevundimonas sp. LF-1 TaxID=3126100 RepID=UPI0030E0DFA3